jgi:arabinose-5-phosphate isomerase
LTNEKILEKGKEVLKIEGEEVLALINKINSEFVESVNRIYNSKGRVVFTGLGKSGLIARKIVATLNSTGTPSIFMHPTDAFHGDLGMVRKDDIVIIISKSGNTDELIELSYLLKRLKVFVIGMVGITDSKLAQECDIILDVSVSEEACPYDLAPTASTTVALAMGDALAVSLLEKRGFTADDFAQLHPGGSLGKRLSLRIKEIMYKGDDVPIVELGASLKDTILEMTSKRLGMTCVVDKEGTLAGIVTDGDLRRMLEESMQIDKKTANDVMTAEPKTIDADYLASFA